MSICLILRDFTTINSSLKYHLMNTATTTGNSPQLTQCRQHRMSKESKTEHNLAFKNSLDGAQQKEAMQRLKHFTQVYIDQQLKN